MELEPVVYGGGQERGLRAGTEDTAPAVALGTAMPMTTIGMLADRVVQATAADRALAAFDPATSRSGRFADFGSEVALPGLWRVRVTDSPTASAVAK